MTGFIHQQNDSLDAIMPYGPYPLCPSGLEDKGNAIYRYAHETSAHPILIIIDPIYDSERNAIAPGYYELVLSDDRQFLVFAQSGKIIAVIPVFKFEEDKEDVAKLYDKKYQKQLAKKQKEQAKIDAKRAKQGMPPQEQEVFMRASIEYNQKERYYLLKYERGRIRAWGAIKG